MTILINPDLFSPEVELENFGRRRDHDIIPEVSYARIKNPALGGVRG